MSVGISVTSSPWKRRLWAKPSARALAAEARRAVMTALPPLLHPRLRVDESANHVAVRWHPAEDGLHIHLNDDGTLLAEANTSTVGPGYHAFAVDVIVQVGRALGVRWDWSPQGEPEGADETGFAVHRDKARLERSMLDWLHAMSKLVVQSDEPLSLALCMPIDRPRPKYEDRAYSPMGLWTRKEFADALNDDEALVALGRRFFPWWSAGMDTSFWAGLGNVLLWCEVPWVSPRDEDERATYELARAAFEEARRLDGAAQLPEREIKELQSLVARRPGPPGPVSTVGHRRRPMTFPLLGPWSVVLPGHFRSSALNDGKNLQIEDGHRAIYAGAFVVAGTTAGELVRRKEDSPDVAWQKDHVHGAGKWSVDGSSRHLMTDDDASMTTFGTRPASAASSWLWRTPPRRPSSRGSTSPPCATCARPCARCWSRCPWPPLRDWPPRPSPGHDALDLADVPASSPGRRVLEIAAAGGHSLLFVAPPGAGTLMLARRLTSILAPLTTLGPTWPPSSWRPSFSPPSSWRPSS